MEEDDDEEQEEVTHASGVGETEAELDTALGESEKEALHREQEHLHKAILESNATSGLSTLNLQFFELFMWGSF